MPRLAWIRFVVCLAMVDRALAGAGLANAAESTWVGITDTAWSTSTNWSLGIPGSADTAVFDGPGNGNTGISLGGGVTTGGLRFSTASAAGYTIGAAGQSLTFSAAGEAVGVGSNVTTAQSIAADVVLGTTGTFTTRNESGGLLAFTGAITTGASGVAALSVDGAGDTTLGGSITAASGTISLLKRGSGDLVLSGSGTIGGGGVVDPGSFAASAVFHDGTTFVSGNYALSGTSGRNLIVGSYDTAGAAGTNVLLVVDAGGVLSGIDGFNIGRGNGTGSVSSDVVLNGTGEISAVTATFGFNGGSALNTPRTTLTLNGSSKLNLSGNSLILGRSAGSNSTMTVNDSALVEMPSTAASGTSGSGLTVGRSGGTGSLVINSGTVRANWVDVARGDNNTQTSIGTVTVRSGGLLTCEGDFRTGFAGNASTQATVMIDGGTVKIASTTERWMILGRYDATNSAVTVSNGGRLDLNANSDIRFTQAGPNTGTNVFTLAGGYVTGYSDNGQTPTGSSVVDLNQGSTSSSVKNTFNLDGGELTIRQVVTTNNTGRARFSMNGGLLRANGDTAALINLGGANQKTIVRNGGARFDTNGFSVTVPEPLLHSDVVGDDAVDGGLVKLGSGTLTLTGTSNYTGSTTVSAGRLNVTTAASLGSGGLTVADSAAFGLTVSGAVNTQFSTSSLSFGTSGLSLDFAGFGNPSLAPLAVSGAVTATGGVTIDLTGFTPVLGSIPLFSYGSVDGFDRLTIGALPLGISGTLVNNTASNTVDLLVTSLNLPRWSGAVSGSWQVGGPQNWVDEVTMTPVAFADGDPVFFNDLAVGSTEITIPSTVTPGRTTIAADSLSYSFSGAGSIAGTGQLVKQGAATATISNTNTFTGGVRIEGGRLAISTLGNGGASAPLGASPAAPGSLVLAGGTLVYTGGSTVSDRGFTVTTGSSAIEVASAAATVSLAGVTAASGGEFSKTGPGTLQLSGSSVTLPEVRVKSGVLALMGPGPNVAGQSVSVQGSLWAGAVPDEGVSLAVVNSTLTVRDYLQIGRGNGTSGVTSSATLTNSVVRTGNLQMGYDNQIVGNAATQTLTLADSTLTNSGVTNIGYSEGSSSTITLSGTSSFSSGNRTLVGMGYGARGAVVIEAGSSYTTAGWMAVGNQGEGTLVVRDQGRFTTSGDFNVADLDASVGRLELSDAASVSAGPTYIGKGSGGQGTVVMTGGTFAGGGNSAFEIGRYGSGAWTQTGGTTTASGAVAVGRYAGSFGSVVINSGTFNHTSANSLFSVGRAGMGELIVNGGELTVAGTTGLGVGWESSGAGTVTMNGGVLVAHGIQGGVGSSSMAVNGGVLRAAADSRASFIDGLGSFTIQSGGLTIDTAGQDLAIPQTLSTDGGSGGLTKRGGGVLTLSGVNSYTGTTTIDEGGVGVVTSTFTTGAYDLAAGTSFGLTVSGYLGSQMTAADFRLAGLNTLGFDLGEFGNPTAAPLVVTGGLATTGSVTIDLLTGRPQLGQFPLIHYGTRTGAGSFTLGSVPAGVTVQLVDNTANNSIDLLISGLASRQWNGLSGGSSNGTWDVGTTVNWVVPPSDPSVFANGDEAIFNDLAQGTTDVLLATVVVPNGVVINNDALAYSFSGAGGIGGPGGLLKKGVGLATVTTTNSFTGGVRIEGGTLAVPTIGLAGSAGPLGVASAAQGGLVLAGGTLSYTGPTATSDRTVTTTGTGGAIDVASAGAVLTLTGSITAPSGVFSKMGAGTLVLASASNSLPEVRVSGTLALVGPGVGAGSQTSRIDGSLWAGAVAEQAGAITVSNATLQIRDYLQVGRGNGTSGVVSSATFADSVVTSNALQLGYDAAIAGNLSTQFLTLIDSSLTGSGNTNIGYSAGSTSTVTLSGTSSLTSGARTLIGLGAGATGVVVVEDSSSYSTAGWIAIGNQGDGTLVVRDQGRFTTSGDFNVADLEASVGRLEMSGSATISTGAAYVGKSVGTQGTVTMTGGTFTAGNDASFQVGRYGNGTWTQTNGITNARGWTSLARYEGSSGVMTISGGTFNQTASSRGFFVGEVGTGTLTVSGSGVLNLTGTTTGLTIGKALTAVGTVNLDGGRISTPVVRENNGAQSSFNFNGGVLQAAGGAQASFMTGLDAATVLSGGAIVDSNGQVIVIDQPLLDGGGGGGLTKLGDGSLALTGASTFSGPVTISAGTLLANGDLSAATGAVSVASGATLGGNGTVGGATTLASGATVSPGASPGTLTFGQTLALGSGANYNWQMLSATGAAGAGDSWDLVNVVGALSVDATSADPFTINLWTLSGTGPDVSGNAANFDSTQDYTWTIASASGGITGFAANKFSIVTSAANGTGGFSNNYGSGTFSVAQSGNNLNLVFTHGAAPSVITINVASGTQTQTAAGYPTLSGTLPLEKTGAGTLVVDQINTISGSTTIQGGVLQLANLQALQSSTIYPVAGGTMTLAPYQVAVVGGLDPNAGGLTDVGSGLVTVSSGLSATNMVTAIVAGMGDGSWNGTTGITSSAAAADAGLGVSRSVGWLDNGDGTVTFGYAAPGDTNLDWSIDLLDIGTYLAAGKYDTGEPSSWSEGDYTYDGLVDITDVALYLGTGLFDVGPYNPPAGIAGGVASVPEPSSWALLAVAGALGLRLRRSRKAA